MSDRTIIIAEAGVNHNGSMEMAKAMVDVAADAGVDYIKFQTFKSELLVTSQAQQADYQKKQAKEEDNSQLSMLRKLELSEENHYELIDYCNERGVKFLSTAFDFKSLEFLSFLNLDFWKIPSGEITNYPYLKKIAQTHLPVVMSTGMCTNEDIERALNVIVNNGVSIKDIILLHCNTQYPTPYSDVNLRAMAEMRERFGVKVGYSDHTEGIDVPIAAVALGACVIEKHFTLDRTLPGPDHRASLEPHELKRMVEAIRNVETALGRANKQVTSSESVNIIAARKSIVASTKIKQGELFTEDNLTVKRPGNGLSPMLWDEVIGKTAYRDFNVDELIELKNQDV